MLKIKRIEYWMRRKKVYKLFESNEIKDMRDI